MESAPLKSAVRPKMYFVNASFDIKAGCGVFATTFQTVLQLCGADDNSRGRTNTSDSIIADFNRDRFRGRSRAKLMHYEFA